jgi:4'-phosphopantetheinyl transferase
MAFSVSGLAQTVPLCWPLAPSDMHLGRNAIHVWCASLNDRHGVLSRFGPVLSPDERKRAGNFHFAKDRDRFIARRGILRELLARYLHQDAATIELSVGRFGKPYVAAPDGGRCLHFNTSHSGGLAVYAVTGACPVGIDVERLREIPGLDTIASRVVDSAERRLTACPRNRQLEAFFASWTSQEAILKASGEGIGADCGARGSHRALPTELPAGAPSDWRLHRLWPAPGYIGALACRHDAARVSLWRVSDCPPTFSWG